MRHSNYPIVFAGLIAAVAFGLATPAAQADPTAVTGASASVTITSPAPVTMLFPFARTGDTGFLAWIHYHTVDGTAVAGTDYTAAAGQLQMPAGAATAGLPVTILGKNANSPDKAFSLALDSIVGTGPLPSFATHPDFPAGSTPFSVTAADVNGDGRPDLIVANNGGAGTVSVFLNTTTPGAAAPSFATHVDFPAGVEPTSATAADLNGDGRPDLIAANGGAGSNVSVLLNQVPPGATALTASSFTPQLTFGVGNNPNSVTTADVNGDGRPDLIVANGASSNTVSVLLNTAAPGAATPTFAIQQPFGVGNFPISVTTADVNGDGRPDLIVVNAGSNTVSVLLNQVPPGATALTASSFTTQQTFGVGNDPQSVTAADINGDDRPDLLVANEQAGTVSVLLNQVPPGATALTASSFTTQQPFTVGSLPASVTTADVNGDGRPDLIAANDVSSGTVSVRLDTTAPGATTPSFATQKAFAVGSSPVSVATADVNGDGRADLLVANEVDNNISVLLNTRLAATLAPASVTGTLHYAVSVPKVTLAPTPLSFGGAVLGTGPVTRSETLTNTGNADLYIFAIGITGTDAADFTQSNNCPAPGGTLAPSTSCTIDVAFTPGAAGARTAALQVQSNASTSLDGVDLSGTGIAANPEIDVSPASLDFGNWPVGTISTTQSVTVTNGGNVSLTITGVSAVGDNSGDFALVSNDCAATLAPGDACTLSFNFTPVAGGARSAGEIVETDDPCASATIAVSGTGLAPEVTLAPTSLAFGNQKVGTTSAALTVTLTNSGNATLTGITLAASSGYLIESTSCAATLAAGADCTIDVSFTPSAPGADNGTLAVTSNASSSPDTVALTGTGTAPAVSLNPAALDFGSLAVGTSSAVETLTVMNSGNAVLDFNGAASVTGADAGDFAIVADSCGATLAMNASCTIGVTFTPGAVGARAASLAIPSDAPAPSPQAAPLTGTGTDNPPVAENGSLSTTTNVAANGTLVATDSDPNQTLSYLIISQPANGAVAITDTHTGAYTYTPGTNFAGTTSFTFKASDGYLDSTTATVTITVTDNPPTASDGTNSTTTNVAVDGQLVAQANNPGQTLTYRVISGAGHGMVTVNEATGAYTYMPATGFAGTDGFTFKANDGNEDSNTATITLTVADLPPIAHDGSAATTTNVPVDGQLTATNPDGAGQTLAFQIVAAPASGSVAVNAGTGAFSYSPKPGFAGSDHFTFRVFDGYLYSNVATVTITVTDIPPVASDGSVSTTVNKSAEGQLKAVAKNPGQILSYHVVAAPASGTVTVNAATGAFTYTPSEDFVGTDHFTFKANDGNEDSNVATETITVTNTPPVAENGSATLDANTSFSGQLQASDADPGQSLTYHAVGQPAHGKLTVNATTGAYSYTPKHNYAGADSFTFKANDGIGDSNVATVTITVNQGGLAVRGGPGGSGGFGLFGLLGLLLLAALLLLRRGGRHPTLPASPLPLAGGGNARGILRVGARPCSENHPPAPPFSHRPQQGGGTLFAIAAALLIFMLAGGNALAAGNTGNAWYVGGEANVIKTDSDRNVATHGFKGWGLYAGKELGRFSLEFNAAYHSDYPKSLSAAANWVTYGVNGLWFFAGRRNAAFSPFALAGAGLMRQYRGDNSEFWSGYDALGIGFTSRPWSAPLRLRVALQFQATFAGNYGDFVAAIGIEIPFGG